MRLCLCRQRPGLSCWVWAALACLAQIPGLTGRVNWNEAAVLGGGWGRMVALTNGHWLAVSTQYPAGTNSYLRISRSTDHARTWTPLAEVREPGRTLDNGELVLLPNGTLLLTMRSLIAGLSYRLPVYASDNGGLTWTYRSNIDASEGTTAQQGKGLWEPDFFVLEDGRLVVTYSNEKHPGYSQVISLRVSADSGFTWGPERRVVAQPGGGGLRPGMSQMTRMANGEYLLVYEVVGVGRADVHCKFSRDGVTWPDGLGLRVPCQHCGPFVAALSNGLVLLSSCENVVSFSEDYGRTWQKLDPPAWPIGFAHTWPALYQTRSNEVAVMVVHPDARLRFGTLRPRPVWPNPWTADFEDGTTAEWTRYGGNFTVEGGRCRLENAGTYGLALAGDGFWTDGILEADLMLTSRGNAGVMFRTTNPDYEGPDHAFGYYAGLDTAGLVLLGRMHNAWTLLTNRAQPVATNTWYRLRVALEGSRISVFVNDLSTPRLTAVDTNYPRGQIGVRAVQCNAQFDRVSFSNAVPLRLKAGRVPGGVQIRWPETAVTVKLRGRPGLDGPADRMPAPGAAVNGYSGVTLPILAEPLRIFWLQAE